MTQPLDQFKATYFNEAAELVEAMEQGLLAMEASVADSEGVHALFRAVHSIKGGALAFGFTEIANFTHVVETLLDDVRAGQVTMQPELINGLLLARDVIAQMLAARGEGHALPESIGAAALKQLQQAATIQPDSSPDAARSIYDIQFAPNAELFLTGNEPLRIVRELRTLGTLTLNADSEALPTLEALDPTACYLRWTMTLETSADEQAVREVFEFVEHISTLTITRRQEAADAQPTIQEVVSTKQVRADTVRVETAKVDRLINMVGELLIAQSMLMAHVSGTNSADTHAVESDIETLNLRTRELQEAVMAIRMQPVKALFARLPRLVRDTANQLQKSVELVIQGEQTELDATIIEKLIDPLTHMIRNAIDHGIELPARRLEVGKTSHGTLTVSASTRSGRILIEVRDDGAGIDRARLLAKAVAAGIVSAEETPSAQEIDQLIFHPGLSTAQAVTDVSGRGVGMDVVRRNIESIGGYVRITNTPSEGASFTLSLPLTLATLDGMAVRVGDEHYIIPIAAIIETLRPKIEDVHNIDATRQVVRVREECIRIVKLHRLFNIAGAQSQAHEALLVLVETARGPLALMVDALIGEQQVVVKNLGNVADAMTGFAGATILGDGSVSLILEVNDLGAMRHEASLRQTA